MSLSAIFLAAAVSGASPVEIRFCPEHAVRSYPANGAQTLVLHNAAVLNRSGAAVRIVAVEVELWARGARVDQRRLEAPQLAAGAEAARRKATEDRELFPAQLCDGRLLEDLRIATGPSLRSGEALLLSGEPFAYGGARDELRLRVRGVSRGREFETAAQLPVRGPGSVAYRLPVRGAWLVAAGPSLHSHHRWTVPEAFALDLVRLGPDGATHRGGGHRLADYFAYGADVLAAAAGDVVAVADGEPEDPLALRQPGEAAAAYVARVRRTQAELLRRGMAALAGNHVIVRHGPGEYAIYAHLQPGLAVKPGDRVAAGQRLGRVGSSGASGEPHLHFQLCDRPSTASCAGIPTRFDGLILPLALERRAVQTGDLVIAP